MNIPKIEPQVETGVAAPQASIAYPFDKMQVGQTFAIPCCEITRYVIKNRVRAAAAYYRSKHINVRFKISSKFGTGEVRVWRTA